MFLFKNVKFKDILDIKDLKFEKGKITCIVGESGSGKSTLLSLLNKLITCDSGEILYNNKLLKNINSVELRRKVVMLPQVPVVFPGDIKENLLIGLGFSEKVKASDEKLQQILEMVYLNKELFNDAERLSGGEKQRLALGRVILLDPDVFLLDEPSSALDEETEEIIIEKLVKHTKKTNKTLIMIVHSKKVAKKYSDQIIEISEGRVLNRQEVRNG